jgi:hypothetical protein
MIPFITQEGIIANAAQINFFHLQVALKQGQKMTLETDPARVYANFGVKHDLVVFEGTLKECQEYYQNILKPQSSIITPVSA